SRWRPARGRRRGPRREQALWRQPSCRGLLEGEGLSVSDSDVRRHYAASAILELHRCLDVLLLKSAVESVDQHCVLLVDEAPPYLVGSRQLIIVGVEFLVQDQVAADLASS